VQGELERVLGVVARRPVPLVVAGRTDRGVHAWGQVASHPGPPVAASSLNALLPRDIAVLASVRAPEDFDARRDAVARTYCYRLHTRSARSPFSARTALHWPYPMDRALLEHCAALLVGTHDFTAFTPTETVHVRFDRVITSAAWRPGERGELHFWITGDAFLRNMVRALVGTMLEVAGGRRSADSFARLLAGAHRREGGHTAPPHGLALARVDYRSRGSAIAAPTNDRP
jgi:tRNA pseudouridine38-40 synthase